MISLEQIRALEGRVEKAVVLIRELRGDNESLARRLAEAQSRQGSAESRCVELEAKIETLSRREAEIQSALQTAEARASIFEARAAVAEAKIPELGSLLSESEKRAVALEEKSARAEARAFELENRAEELRREQMRIEEGIVHALEKLDAFEDLVLGSRSSPATEASPTMALPTTALSALPEASEPDGQEEESFAEAVSALDEALGLLPPDAALVSGGDDATEVGQIVRLSGEKSVRESAPVMEYEDDGAIEEEAAVWTPTAPVSQEPTFPGAENELDIF